MKVMFSYNSGFDRISSVYWEESGAVKSRTLLSNGSFRDKDHRFKTLREAFRELYGSYNPFYVAEVDDIRSAFKYLGKASDLVETLPKASFDDAEQPAG